MKNEIGEWLEPNEGEDLSTSEGRLFKKDPAINIISKEEFENRVEKVFYLLWKSLAKSFGPYGAPTLIYSYPFRHITKDGYTIMKHLSFDASETKVDQAIADMAGDICGRLNYSVGDGTTSAIIATNSIYQKYLENKKYLTDHLILPRDVMKKYDVIKCKVIDELQKSVQEIRTEDPDELYQNIYDVVYVSSNGDELISDYIADLYRSLGSPGISCIKAPDGITKKKLINGYKYNLTLNDRLYINNDDNTMKLENADVVIFATKITETTYRKILKPLSEHSEQCGRHLIVAAPSYDELSLVQVIAPELNAEYSKKHDVNMVLTTYRAISAHTRKLVNDFSVLMNTTVIDRAKEEDILQQLDIGKTIFQVFNIEDRQIPGTRCFAITKQGPATYVYGTDDPVKDGFSVLSEAYPLDENCIRLGFVKSCYLGLKESQFIDLLYDEDRYQTILKEAKDLLEETEAKYKRLGTFNLEVSQCQERLYALNLKMGIIEVGADSEMSQALLKDAVDDAVRAAESAYKHGVVLGCNVNLLQAINNVSDIISDNYESDDTDETLVRILYDGFRDVYKTVLSNAFDDVIFDDMTVGIFSVSKKTINEIVTDIRDYVNNYMKNTFDDIFDDIEEFSAIVNEYYRKDSIISLHDIIIDYSIATSQVFDLSTFTFTEDVINSLQTDQEILTATVDLISLLIVGNQMVVTQKHDY